MSGKTGKGKALPKGWREVRLGDVCSFRGGSGFPEIYQGKGAGDYPFIKVSDMSLPENKVYIQQSNNWITSEVKKQINATHCPANSIVFAKVGAALKLNRRRILIRDTIIDNNMMVAIPSTSEIFPKFLYYYLITKDFGQFCQESAVPSVNQKILGNLSMRLPPIESQKAIASLLETWDTAIEKTEALIAVKEKRFKWLLKTLISDQWNNPEWRKVKLGDVGLISSAGVDKKTVEGEKLVRLVNYLDVLREDFILSDNLNHWVTAPEGKIVQCNVRKGDIFFTPSSEIQGDIAHSAVSLKDIEKAVYSYHIVRFRLKENWDLMFRGYVFKASEFYRQAYRLCDGSGQRYVISQDNFRRMVICIPDINEQKRIANILRITQQEIDSLKKIAGKYYTQKRGLMQQILTGKKRVKIS